MKRKDFLSKGALGILTTAALPTILTSCKDDNFDPNACEVSPTETAGPFPIRTPADLVRENIIGDRTGIPLLMSFTIQDVSNSCSAISGAIVDVWHCDAQGNYSEYDGQLQGDFTNDNFLRGRQTTNASGVASFLTIYPGWYPGRTPHIHLEVRDANGNSLLITQVSFPEDVSETVYATTGYNGSADTNNSNDGIVSAANMADGVTGNTTDGYTLTKVIRVNG